tara:strand:- start:26311 stop:26844 length:534 start_codon:yes stop_codon:yes gene_type:complete
VRLAAESLNSSSEAPNAFCGATGVFDLGDVVGCDRHLACRAAHVDRNLADLLRGCVSLLGERRDGRADGDDEAVHRVAHPVLGAIDILFDALEQRFDLGEVQVVVGGGGHDPGIGAPTCSRDVLLLGIIHLRASDSACLLSIFLRSVMVGWLSCGCRHQGPLLAASKRRMPAVSPTR